MKMFGDFQKGQYAERNLRFGVREHGMGAIDPLTSVAGLILARWAWPLGFPRRGCRTVTTAIATTIAATLFWTKT
jgi:hypothetical protein